MAQGTTDKRFLTKPAKTVSAGILLALTVAVLLLAGCGGGSSDTSSSTAAANSASGEASGDVGAEVGAGTGAEAGKGAGAPSASNATETSGSGDQSGQSSTGDGKHGPSVPQPTGEPAPKITPTQRREATVADLTLQSPSSLPSSGGARALPAQYTCDGKNTSPALNWQGVPEGTAELVLFAMNTRPVEGKLFFDWAVAGLSPESEEIKAGELPKGAVVGRNSFGKKGYEVCPEGEGETYIFTLFALPKKLSPAQGFDPLDLRLAVLKTSGNVGLLALSYTR